MILAHTLKYTNMCLFVELIDWLIGFKGMSTRLGLFYAKELKYSVRCSFSYRCFLVGGCTQLYDIKYSYQIQIMLTVRWFQVFLSNTNNYLVSSNYFYLIRVICFHTFIGFQVINYNL